MAEEPVVARLWVTGFVKRGDGGPHAPDEAVEKRRLELTPAALRVYASEPPDRMTDRVPYRGVADVRREGSELQRVVLDTVADCWLVYCQDPEDAALIEQVVRRGQRGQPYQSADELVRETGGVRSERPAQARPQRRGAEDGGPAQPG